MEIRLQKWGNSMGIRIPSSILKTLNINKNDKLELYQEDDRIVIVKSNNQKISLKQLFDEYHGKNLAKDFEWDDPVGREIW